MSGRKNVLPPYHAISSGDMSVTVTQVSPTTIQYLDNVYVQLVFTGTPTGAFQIQVSNNKLNWDPIAFSTSPAAAGSAGSISLDLQGLSMPYLRIVYVPTSGSGTLDAWISGKQV